MKRRVQRLQQVHSPCCSNVVAGRARLLENPKSAHSNFHLKESTPMECNNGDLKFELSEVLNSFKVETERTALAVATKT